MVTRAMGIGPAASLFASGALANDAKLVIGDLSAAPEDSALASIVTEAVLATLSQSRAVRLVEPADVATLLTEMRRPRNAHLDPTTAREVAIRGNATAVLGGRFARAGEGYAISLELSGAKEVPDQFSSASHDSYIRLARGRIESADGDYSAAVREFRGAATRTDGQEAWGKPSALIALGDAFDKLQEPDSVIFYYQRFLALSTDEQLRADVAADGLAKIHKRLGEIYESRGDRAQAIEHDAAFVELWQDADAELQPVVAEVRARLADLQAAEGP